MSNVPEIVKVALNKGLKCDSDNISAGDHEIDAIVHIQGVIRKGDDYEQTFWTMAKPEAMLYVALSKLNGVTIDSIVREAMEADTDKVTIFKKKADEAVKTLKKAMGKKTAKGKVTFPELTVELINETVSPESVAIEGVTSEAELID